MSSFKPTLSTSSGDDEVFVSQPRVINSIRGLHARSSEFECVVETAPTLRSLRRPQGCRRTQQGAGSPSSIREVVSHPTVEISPPDVVTRRSLTGQGITAESVNHTGPDTVIHRFRAPQHLLVAYEQGERTSSETFVEGTPPSRLRNLARRLTFVPAGHEYRE